MTEIVKNNRAFIGYEYKEVITNAEKVSFLIDVYENFGWIVDKNITPSLTRNTSPRNSGVVLRLKRDRKIMNKMELTRLQRNFEFCMKDIEQLETSKTSRATMYALIVAFIGTAFMAGSVFAVTADPPRVVLCTFLAIPAFAGWILPYFIYKKVERERTEKVNPLIEETKDQIYELCEKGNKLLHEWKKK
jgi:hypothetical protein